MRRGVTKAVIVLAILAALGAVATAVYWKTRASLARRYDVLRADRIHGATWVDVDRQTYEDWLATIDSPHRETMRTTTDAFSAKFNSLRDAGFSPDIDGYLKFLTADLPASETLSLLELNRWCNAAGLRVILGGSKANASLYVYRENGIVRGFRLPTYSRKDTLRLGILQNGSYAEYVSQSSASPTEDSVKN